VSSRYRLRSSVLLSAACAAAIALLLARVPLAAHHEILAKFDEGRRMTLSGVVTLVDWRNPHVHVFVNVRDARNDDVNWAIELESPIDLQHSGWNAQSLKPGDAVRVEGMAARDGSRQVWGTSLVLAANGRQVLNVTPRTPPPLSGRPTPRWADGRPRLGAAPRTSGYWSFPSASGLVENGVMAAMNAHGLLRNLMDAPKVAPLQGWALALYTERQRRSLRDDPGYLHCKPPGGPRQFQSPHGVQFLEDRDRHRIFVLVGSGNNNFRIIYTDARAHVGQVSGDDDNPLYYGRSVATWDGDALVADTRGFNEDFWFTNGGLPHTDQLRLIERFTRPDFDTLRYEVTIEDPGAYTRPWSSTTTLRWIEGEELPRHLCQDNRP
jgi:Family of unknown function (DUF6152)